MSPAPSLDIDGQPQHKTLTFWDQIDAVLVINLKHRVDRWESICGQLAKMGVSGKIHRVDAVAGKSLGGYKARPWFRAATPERVCSMKAGSAGCCLSHRKAIAYAKAQGFKCILLLEDDAVFKNSLDGREGNLVAQVIQKHDQWDMIYLGCYQKKQKYFCAHSETIDGHTFELRRIRGPLLMHAMVIQSTLFDALLAGLPTEDAVWPWMTYWGSIDSWIQNKFGRNPQVKIWSTAPKLVVQQAAYSDIVGRVLTVEESEGVHRPVTEIPLAYPAFEKSIPLSLAEAVYQTVKRSGRLVRAFVFGYTKT